MKQHLKQWVCGILNKDPDAVVVTFATGDPELCRRMAEQVRELVPDRRHFFVTEETWPSVKRELRRCRIGLAPVLLDGQKSALRRAAFLRAPRKILAFNSRLERHHLRFDLASLLFWCGVRLDRIHLRPWWWPWPQRERSSETGATSIYEGRPCDPARRRVAVLSPYIPYPLSHGGAVRMFNLLREIAESFDVGLFTFTDGAGEPELEPLLKFCARIVVVGKPSYREPRWSSLAPPEVHEFSSRAMRRVLAEQKRAFGYEVLQVEYTQMAGYAGDVLVEHDVTFDLFGQIARRNRSLSAFWDYWRWHRYETRAVQRFRRTVVMSEKDAAMLGERVATTVLANGVDLSRYQPSPEVLGERLLFIGSFRHFPNIAAFEFFIEQVWPLLSAKFPSMTLTVVAGPDPLLYWRAFSDKPEPPADPRIEMRDFVADVRPLYEQCNLVLVPTTVSAGTNVKVLEAMAMRRAVVSTTSGCAGLGLVHGHSVWVGDTPEAFAAGVATLISDPERRTQIADAAYFHALRNFDWKSIGERQRALLSELISR